MTTFRKRPSRSKDASGVGNLGEIRAALNSALKRKGIRTDGQLMRENYLAGKRRKAAQEA